jgi:hypothetical protein
MSGRVRHHNFGIWDSKKFHVLLTRPDPACLRAPPVFMNFVCHSRIDGVLEGNGKLSEFFAILKKLSYFVWPYPDLYLFKYLKNAVLGIGSNKYNLHVQRN